MIIHTLYGILYNLVIPIMSEPAITDTPPLSQATKGLYALALIIIIPVLIVMFFTIRSVYKHTVGKKLQTTILEDYRKEAEGLEKSGRFVSSANVYEKKLKDYHKAASLYEKGGDYHQAAMLYDLIGKPEKAKEMYEKAGSPEDAAEVALMEGEFEEAAGFYEKAGKKEDVAKVMQQAGKNIYAVKAYREAKEYKKAALLLQADGMYSEAAEMFGFHLHDKSPEASNLDDFYTYALLLDKTGDLRTSFDIMKKIVSVNPLFRDVKQRLESLEPPFQEEEILKGMTPLRNFLRSERIDPVHSLKLWVQMLKSLQESYAKAWPFGLLSPESIAIDAKNNVSFVKKKPQQAYSPPETIKGFALDERADIYSAGVILYEMLTGSLDGLGSIRVMDVSPDVPEWLDEIVIKCIKKVREDRYQYIKEIFADLKALSKGKM